MGHGINKARMQALLNSEIAKRNQETREEMSMALSATDYERLRQEFTRKHFQTGSTLGGSGGAGLMGSSYPKREERYLEECRCPECNSTLIVAATCSCAVSKMPPCGACENSMGTCAKCGFSGNYETWLDIEEAMNDKLHSAVVDGKEIFGYKRAVASDGKVIFEEHGTAALHKVEAGVIEAVIPYSVGIKFLDNSGKVYHYYADKDEFKVDDLLMGNNGSYATVVELDTKSELANKRFSGWVLSASRISK